MTLTATIPTARAPNIGTAAAATGLLANINIQYLTGSYGKGSGNFTALSTVVPSIGTALSTAHVKRK
jgi:hypothetical protein